MLNATLGGLLKDYRLQKGIDQLDIALALGWSEPSRLSRIEQGKVMKPNRETLDKIMEVMELSEIEKNTLLLIGNYLPTEEEIQKIKKLTDPIVKTWPYPSTVLDLTWRVVNSNDKLLESYNIPPENNNYFKHHPRVPELVLNYINQIRNKLQKAEQVEEWYIFFKYLLLLFRFEQRDRIKEKWYSTYIKEMFKNELFYRLWGEAQNMDVQPAVLGKFIQTSILNPKDPKKRLNFYLFLCPVLVDPRFEVQRWVPVDQETFQFFNP